MHPASPTPASPPASGQPEPILAHRQRLEMLGVLAAGVAHDFNLLLTSIDRHLTAADALLPPGHPARLELHQVQASVNRASELTGRVLALGRSDEGSRVVDLVTFVEGTIPLLRTSIPRSIELRTCVHHLASACVAIDPHSLRQVIFNLALNGAQAIGAAAGAIELGLARVPADELPPLDVGQPGSGAMICLSISDTGSGFDAASRTRLFDPHFTTRPPGQGAGLGLAIVQSIVLRHQGAIAVQSVAGEGTLFRIYFPEAATGAARGGAAAPRPASAHIAIVDDEETVVRLATQALEFSGYRATPMVSADACLAHIMEQPQDVDLIITDQRLPTMTGIELVRSLRERGLHTPVLITSGSISSVTGSEIRSVGPALFLPKPFALVDLLGAVRELLPQPSEV